MDTVKMKDVIRELLIEFHKEALHNYISEYEMGRQELARNYADKVINVLYDREGVSDEEDSVSF